MSLTASLRKAGIELSAKDKSAILLKAREYRKEGVGATEAGKRAVDDLLAEVLAELPPGPVKDDR